jgi:hypothetical protein
MTYGVVGRSLRENFGLLYIGVRDFSLFRDVGVLLGFERLSAPTPDIVNRTEGK